MDTLTIILEVEDGEQSVVTRQRPVSLHEYFAVREAIAAASWGDRASIEAAYAAFEPVLISWTFDSPATAAGMAELDVLTAMAIMSAWRDEVRNVPPPLARRSSAGEPSPEP